MGTTAGRENVRAGPWPAAADDKALLARVALEDRQAFRALVDRHVAYLVALARRMLADEAEADDIAQETLLRLWRGGAKLDIGAADLRPWLRRVATNLCLDRLRGAQRTVVTDAVPESAEPAGQLRSIEQREMTLRVQQAMDALPERQRIALTLFHHEGMSLAEIAAMLGTSDEAVESLLARARRGLKELLADEWKGLLARDQD